MGFRCSLLGHDYGEADVEREREERGSEVVITVRDVKECSRCGNTSIVSENKEVTSIESASEESSAEMNESVDDQSTQTTFDADESVDPAEDDGVILEDDGDEAEQNGRQHGQWPDADDRSDDAGDADDSTGGIGAGSTHEWPSVNDDDGGYDAEPSYGESTGVEFGGGLAPEKSTTDETAAEEEGVEFIESSNDDPQFDAGAPTAEAGPGDASDAGFTRADTADSAADAQTDDLDTELVCPDCGYVSDTFGSSLRAGDVCPECRRGYLAEQEA